MTFWFVIDALSLSERRLVRARATKLGSCDSHTACCWERNVDMCLHTVCAMIEIVVVHFNSGEYMRKDHTGCPEGKA